MAKQLLRKTMLSRRKQHSAGELAEAGDRIQLTLIASPEFRAAQVVALYAPIHGEVATDKVMAAALAAGKTVLFPAVCDDSLRFVAVADHGQLQPGAYGIPEPCPTEGVVPVECADLVVVPGVAFDLGGRRVGYGKGYYDRAVHHLEGQGRLVAFCYDFQLVAEIAGEPHDVAVDRIITETRIIRPLG
ncbi:5-formyltetrahydrofolate cyclo-ligase [Geotalea uraniireducens]|uniref:5-formyltetrahydrofolate cyclo-ligase n=1 Tax=Geotalea uraniireducens TaxID=351604 RepID=A0ABM8EIU2_9BACT|nr:5-formyltetrahydrofolate cyclo-ligase [Geotalea uraniireducens]BDV42356.1 5-formyltetrahydrofolate cyclo-ligase [Geotalea uraniireducens]